MHAGPEAFLSREAASDEYLDLYSDVAVSEWAQKPGSGKALAKLAELLRSKHNDLWLSDFVSAPRDGLSQLVEAMQANSSGNYGEALTKAAESVKRFRRMGNRAGRMRAERERVYALQRMLRGDECLSRAARLVRDLAPLRYAALRIQAAFELASCWNESGHIAPALSASAEALKEARAVGFRSLQSRGIAMIAGLQVDLGDAGAVYDPSISALESFWSSPSPPIRGHFLLINLSLAAEQEERPFAAYALRSEAVSVIEGSADRLLLALSLSKLASVAQKLDARQSAIQEYERAEKLFGTMPLTPTVREYLMDARMSRAVMLAQSGNKPAALKMLERERDQFSRPPTPLMSAELHTQLGKLYQQLGDGRAETEFSEAVTFRRAYPGAIHTHGNTYIGLAAISEAYRSLAEILAARGEWARALAMFEERSYRSPGPLSSGPQTASLAYAVLGDRVAVWLVQDGTVEGHWLDVSARELSVQAHRFAQVCSDPRSSEDMWRHMARILYDDLLGPVTSALRADRAIVIEPDGPLLDVPFAALLGLDGRFLIDRSDLVLTDNVAAHAHWGHKLRPRISAGSEVLAVADPALRGEIRRSYPPLTHADVEVRMISRYFPKMRVIDGRRATLENVERWQREAAVFHFAGHGFTNAGAGGLLLAPADAKSDFDVLDSKTVAENDWTHCELAVLSSCSSGAERTHYGHPESVVRSFLEAGAKRVLAALWSVDSDVTAQLMQEFYGDIAAGRTPAAALRSAVGFVRRRHPHPYYWAAFQLYGAQ